MKKILFILFLILSFASSFAAQWNLPWIKIVTRQEWGANSKYLFLDYKAYQNIIKQDKDLDERIATAPWRYKGILKKRAIEKKREKYLLTHWKNQIKADKVVRYMDW